MTYNHKRMKDEDLQYRLAELNLEIGELYEEYLYGGAAWGMIVLAMEEMLAISKEMYQREQV